MPMPLPKPPPQEKAGNVQTKEVSTENRANVRLGFQLRWPESLTNKMASETYGMLTPSPPHIQLRAPYSRMHTPVVPCEQTDYTKFYSGRSICALCSRSE